MKYIAICPCCSKPVPRGWIFTSQMNLTCPNCRASIRRARGRNITGDFLSTAILICAFPVSTATGALVGYTLAGWWVTMVGALIGLVAVIPAWILTMHIVFPYLSAYEEVTARCGHCGYNLSGNTSGVCPECGIAVLQKSEPARLDAT